jgi:cell division protein ZapA
MGQIWLPIGGYNYAFTCRDGDEAHALRLGEMVDVKVKAAVSSVGSASEVRQLMLGALLLADEVIDARAGVAPVAASTPPTDFGALEAIAARLEALASKLENGAA